MTKERCYDFREIRRWVMCKAWELMETEKLRFRDAVKKAWDLVRIECAKVGAYV